jgi:hypothetical protein
MVFKVSLHFFATTKNFLNLLIPKERLLAVKGGPMPLIFGYVDAFEGFYMGLGVWVALSRNYSAMVIYNHSPY